MITEDYWDRPDLHVGDVIRCVSPSGDEWTAKVLREPVEQANGGWMTHVANCETGQRHFLPPRLIMEVVCRGEEEE